MSDAIRVGADGVYTISTRTDFDRVEIYLIDAAAQQAGIYVQENVPAGVTSFTALSLFAGKAPGDYKLRAIGYKGTTVVKPGNFVDVKYDPVQVNSSLRQPEMPQLSVQAFGGFG